jgi:hypothetical protein
VENCTSLEREKQTKDKEFESKERKKTRDAQ